MVQLYLLRHGDALPSSFDDAHRPLSPLGEEQAHCVARILEKLNVRFDAILCSPLVRAQQTARVVQSTLSAVELTTTEHLVPASDHRQIFQQLNHNSWKRILLVGHEPHLSTMISLLTGGSRSVRVEMKTASLALCESGSPIEPGSSVLRWVVNHELSKLLIA